MHKIKHKKSSEKYTQLVKFNITHSNLQCFFKRLKSNTSHQPSKIFKSKDKITHRQQTSQKYTIQKNIIKNQQKFNHNNLINSTQNSKNQLCKYFNPKSKSPDLASQIVNKILKQIQTNQNDLNNYQQEKETKTQQNQEINNQLNQKIWSSSYLVTPNKSFNSTDSSNLSQQTTLFNNYNNYQYYYNNQIGIFDQSFNLFEVQSYEYSKNQFEIYEQQILKDNKTTVMIKNIPNKYTLKLLTDQIDQKHQNKYDFLYLPFDFNNNCNIGYAFINFIDKKSLKQFYQSFNNKKWLKFRSQKICILTYARLQGRNSLIEHFHNSKVLNQKDKRFRPLIKQVSNMQKLSNLLDKQRIQSKKKFQK